MRTFVLLAAFCLAGLCLAGPAAACGEASDCAVAGGDYRIAWPAAVAPDAETGALVFLHGWQGTPEQMLGFAALRATADRLGVALILPRGLGKSWSLPDAFAAGRDEIAFLNAVFADAAVRFPVDPARIVVSGFSLGGSMTWYLACAEGGRYAGYVPVAGAFWEPYVEDCAGGARIHHVHGLADDMVPMEGRPLLDATQGDVRRSFALLRDLGGCPGGLAGATAADGLECSRQDCGGAVQELCLHPGGHAIRPEWIERAWREIAAERGWR